ncbi:helix-turn-helix transcriptional regulator [Marinobacter bohaiensis]|uniref:helix-turn-helix transcriptional regulator n=1 Tax=Marinobacter bohaiensis TaxID=2201898 RepID=UPI0013A6F687|nr:helix-turn-helix transcriptional regulator [Marinobacter bohaiensis]
MSRPSPQNPHLLNTEDLEHNARHLNRYRLRECPAPASAGHSMLRGTLLTEKLASGLSFHIVNARAERDIGFDAELSASLKISLFLEGQTRFQFGNRHMALHESAAQAQVMTLSHAESCSMKTAEGEQRTALYVAVEPEWFEQQALDSKPLKRRMQQHLSVAPWSLPPSLWMQARHLIEHPDPGRIGQLAREGFALSLMTAWLETLPADSAAASRLTGRQARQFLELLESDTVLAMTQSQIGNQLGMSPATLQRYARDCLGMGVGRFLRQRRLQNAYRALQQDGASITEASALAGYGHPNNFTAAFRRQFGISPSQAGRA